MQPPPAAVLDLKLSLKTRQALRTENLAERQYTLIHMQSYYGGATTLPYLKARRREQSLQTAWVLAQRPGSIASSQPSSSPSTDNHQLFSVYSCMHLIKIYNIHTLKKKTHLKSKLKVENSKVFRESHVNMLKNRASIDNTYIDLLISISCKSITALALQKHQICIAVMELLRCINPQNHNYQWIPARNK